MIVKYEPVLAMALRPGWVEVGPRRSEMKKINFEAGEMAVCDVWLGVHGMESLVLTVSDPALRAANHGISGDVELRVVHKFAHARLGALVASVDAERVAGFRASGCFWIPLSSRSLWPWSMIMRSGAHHRGYIEAG